jgi:hypothetical protein
MRDLTAGFVVGIFLRMVGLVSTNMAATKSAAVFLMWGVPLGGILVAAVMVHYQIKPLTLPSLSLPSLPWRTAKQAAS